MPIVHNLRGWTFPVGTLLVVPQPVGSRTCDMRRMEYRLLLIYCWTSFIQYHLYTSQWHARRAWRKLNYKQPGAISFLLYMGNLDVQLLHTFIRILHQLFREHVFSLGPQGPAKCQWQRAIPILIWQFSSRHSLLTDTPL
ncbi:hypothetical protein BJ138DRAFT_1153779 [Hygrophoropsis aurantiaca]|uniref:Uncharacterized protein n=1 Tax=Hygrophoropsis aurantiaca TaxID=72124 RepID=A0ACB8A9Y3_9AGAM|nr:hypothetical protein BJ138DRAFT_1153779 [Hygrophoropsis aurantiaca]